MLRKLTLTSGLLSMMQRVRSGRSERLRSVSLLALTKRLFNDGGSLTLSKLLKQLLSRASYCSIGVLLISIEVSWLASRLMIFSKG